MASKMNRRRFLLTSAGSILSLSTGEFGMAQGLGHPVSGKARVSLVKGQGRETAVSKAIDLLADNPVRGKAVLLKPNFNTADPYPASTHNDTLTELVRKLQAMGASAITIGERAGPPLTADVLAQKGIPALCRKLGIGLINFEDLPEAAWIRVKPAGSHWRNGFEVAKPVLDSECVVATCCLKTHGYGGVFTMSLKLAVGITHKRNMHELHSSSRSMRKMIAEINQAYRPALVLMDGVEVFTDGGPMRGERKRGDLFAASADRIALDAVGLAVLKELGANRAIMDTRIFAQEQIARAVELGLGVSRPDDIEIVTDDPESAAYAGKLTAILKQDAA